MFLLCRQRKKRKGRERRRSEGDSTHSDPSTFFSPTPILFSFPPPIFRQVPPISAVCLRSNTSLNGEMESRSQAFTALFRGFSLFAGFCLNCSNTGRGFFFFSALLWNPLNGGSIFHCLPNDEIGHFKGRIEVRG